MIGSRLVNEVKKITGHFIFLFYFSYRDYNVNWAKLKFGLSPIWTIIKYFQLLFDFNFNTRPPHKTKTKTPVWTL